MAIATIAAVRVRPDGRVTATVVLDTPEGPVTLSLTFVRRDGRWLIDAERQQLAPPAATHLTICSRDASSNGDHC